jgi:hypothetical protein
VALVRARVGLSALHCGNNGLERNENKSKSDCIRGLIFTFETTYNNVSYITCIMSEFPVSSETMLMMEQRHLQHKHNDNANINDHHAPAQQQTHNTIKTNSINT